jgi:enoyl-CoA hydratase/carnithine racemase
MTTTDATEPLVLQDSPVEGVVRLTLNRPARLNALSRALVADLDAALAAIDLDVNVRCVILAGNGRAFCAGADLHEHFTDGDDEAPDIGRSPVWNRIETLTVPVIASVHGAAITGGFLLAYSCDLIVAAEDAVFRDTHAALGIIPTGGETQRLPRRIPAAIARELFYTSRPLGAVEAQRLGLVNRVVPRADLEASTLELAATVAAGSRRSIAAIKSLVDLGSRVGFDAGLHLETIANRNGAANLEPDPERERRIEAFRHGQRP